MISGANFNGTRVLCGLPGPKLVFSCMRLRQFGTEPSLLGFSVSSVIHQSPTAHLCQHHSAPSFPIFGQRQGIWSRCIFATSSRAVFERAERRKTWALRWVEPPRWMDAVPGRRKPQKSYNRENQHGTDNGPLDDGVPLISSTIQSFCRFHDLFQGVHSLSTCLGSMQLWMQKEGFSWSTRPATKALRGEGAVGGARVETAL